MEHQPPKRPGLLDAPPKTTFVLGLLAGGFLMALVGVAVLVPLLAARGSTKTATTTTPTVANTNADTGPRVVNVPPVTDSDHVRGGGSNAPLTIVEYSDFQCPFCQAFHPTLQRLQQEYGDKVRFVYRHFPLTTIHPEAQPAAEAAECASAQGKFWEYGDKLFENQQSLGATYYPQLAKDLGLNVAKFNDCLAKGDGKAAIAANVADATSLGVNGTPTSYIVGKGSQSGIEIAGAQPYDYVKAQVDAALGSS